MNALDCQCQWVADALLCTAKKVTTLLDYMMYWTSGVDASRKTASCVQCAEESWNRDVARITIGEVSDVVCLSWVKPN